MTSATDTSVDLDPPQPGLTRSVCLIYLERRPEQIDPRLSVRLDWLDSFLSLTPVWATIAEQYDLAVDSMLVPLFYLPSFEPSLRRTSPRAVPVV